MVSHRIRWKVCVINSGYRYYLINFNSLVHIGYNRFDLGPTHTLSAGKLQIFRNNTRKFRQEIELCGSRMKWKSRVRENSSRTFKYCKINRQKIGNDFPSFFLKKSPVGKFSAGMFLRKNVFNFLSCSFKWFRQILSNSRCPFHSQAAKPYLSQKLHNFTISEIIEIWKACE